MPCLALPCKRAPGHARLKSPPAAIHLIKLVPEQQPTTDWLVAHAGTDRPHELAAAIAAVADVSPPEARASPELDIIIVITGSSQSPDAQEGQGANPCNPWPAAVQVKLETTNGLASDAALDTLAGTGRSQNMSS